ncbi:MAG: phosphoribosyltransferase family protein [Candidatus Berkiellales bacterium]
MNNWLKIVQQLLAACLRLPCHCLLCLSSIKRDFGLCESCEQALPWLSADQCRYCALPLLQEGICDRCQYQTPPYDKLQALFEYQWPVDAFIGKLKYNAQLSFAKILGKLLAMHLTPLTPVDCIVAMPLAPDRQRERGYNQSILLAEEVAKIQQIKLDRWSCIRKINTSSQATLSASKRASNITENAFAISRQFNAQHVLVIDDVVTTGSTVKAFTLALKNAGVKTVEVWACCRTGLTKKILRCGSNAGF